MRQKPDETRGGNLDMQENCTCSGTDQEKALQQIANVIDFYKGREGSLIQVLHLAQQIYGSLPLEVQTFISKEMDIPLSVISGVVSFYSFFSTVPRGEHTIRVCLGTACYVRGGKRVLEGLKERLGVELGDTTQDGKFTLEVARCIGACGLAPAMMIDDVVFKQVNVNKLDKILGKF
jgi:NADH:ubiquinone oxidoreductase subunit E